MHSTPTRRRLAATTLGVGVALLAVGLLTSPAQAAGDPIFGAGYDSYLHDPHRGTAANSGGFVGTCPSDATVAALTAWHLVLNGSSHDFVTLDVALTIDGSNVTLTGLVPVAKPTDAAGWAAFDPATEFIADPNTKHAYVYAGDGDDVLRDAAAQLNPDSPADKFVLSHICPSPVTTTTTEEETTTTEEETTTTTEEETTTTTEEETTTTAEEETTTTAQVLGNVVTPAGGVAAAQLPRTGDNDQALALIGAGLLLIGGGAMLVRRDLLGHS